MATQIDLEPIIINPMVIGDLTGETLDGKGAFDTLMRAGRNHLDAEFKLGRIKGPEYATVYLGSLQQMMGTALQFLIAGPKAALEAQLLAVQIELAKVEVLKAENQRLQIAAQTRLIEQQILNAVVENTVLVAQECKLRADFDFTMAQIPKAVQETLLLAQKMATERAQTSAMGVDADSVVGRQKGLYVAQTDGFKRDAEQKGVKLLIDTWNVRRTTDEGTVADETNKLSDATIGRAVTTLLAGIGA